MERNVKFVLLAMLMCACAGVVSADLVAYYKFDNNYVDETGLHADAVEVPNPSEYVTFEPGKYGQSVGVMTAGPTSSYRDYVDTGIVNGGTGSMTMTSWVNLDSSGLGVSNFLAGKVYVSPNRDWSVEKLANNTVRFQIAPTGSTLTQIFTTTTLGAGEWIHVAAVYDALNATMKVYFNGVEQSTTLTGVIPTSRFNGNKSIQITGRNGTNEYWHGRVDEFRYYDSALSQAEVQATMIPEPATLVLLGLGAVAAFRRKR